MKYVAVDIETTGLDIEQCQILQVALVIDDLITPVDKLPKYEKLIRTLGPIKGEAYALSMHSELLKQLASHQGFIWIDRLPSDVSRWLDDNDMFGIPGRRRKITFAGKNAAGFDLPFLDHHCKFSAIIPRHHRVLDVGSVYWHPEDDEVPNLKECKIRAGLEPTVAHTALEDALDVVRLIRRKFGVAL